jgi:hypothetical protein
MKPSLLTLREIGGEGADGAVAHPANTGKVIDDPIANEQPHPEEKLGGFTTDSQGSAPPVTTASLLTLLPTRSVVLVLTPTEPCSL